MRNWLCAAAAAAVMAVGCNKSPEGSSPNSPGSFTISGPDFSTTIKQGDKQTINLTLNRKSGFSKDVKLKVDPPQKIKAELNKSEIKGTDPTEFTLTVAPDKDADLGEQHIKVTGTAEGGGNPVSVDVKIKVEKNP